MSITPGRSRALQPSGPLPSPAWARAAGNIPSSRRRGRRRQIETGHQLDAGQHRIGGDSID
jgi:hypothetical protein